MNEKYLAELLADLEGKKDDKGYVKVHIDVSRPLIVELLRQSPLDADPACSQPLDAKSLAELVVKLETDKSETGYMSVHEDIWRPLIVKLLQLSQPSKVRNGSDIDLDDLLHTAMCIIANARGGWEGSPDRQAEWTEAADRWQEEYHATLPSALQPS